jgi:hypothetical protein
MVREAEKIAKVTFRPTQGSYSRGALSAGTHSGGGAIDLSVRGYSVATRERVVRALRTVGFAAWYRSGSEGPWASHIHAIAIGTRDAAPVAKRQVVSYKNGKSGLRSNRRDRHAYMKVPFRTWEQYLVAKKGAKGRSWTVASAPGSVKVNTVITITGKTSPVAGPIVLQRWVGGKWVSMKKKSANTSGRFVWKTTPVRTGQYVYRVLKVSTARRHGSVSKTLRVRVY